MFNIGIISGRSQKLVNLYDFEHPVTSGDTNFSLLRNGSASYYSEGSNPLVPNMWWIGPANALVGDSYQARWTLQAGTAPSGPTQNVWTTIGGGFAIVWLSGIRGRIRLEIRDIATQTIRASCRIWRGPYAP